MTNKWMLGAFAILFIWLQSCQHSAARYGDECLVIYTIHTVDGLRIDDSHCTCNPALQSDIPLKIRIGHAWVIKPWDEALIGMVRGQTKTLIIPPKQGFGSHHNPAGIEDTVILKFTLQEILRNGHVFH